MPEYNGKVAHIWQENGFLVLKKYSDAGSEEPQTLPCYGELIEFYRKGLTTKLKAEGYIVRYSRPQ